MRVDLHFTPHQVDELSLRDKTVVVVDVLRASTSIITALHNGAKEIIPVTTVERAVKISGNLFGDYVLRGGERNGKIIEGFNLGNSPADYSEDKVKGKAIIFSSTNGSFAIDKARYALHMVVCGFVNISSVLEFLAQKNRDFTVVCAGNNGMFSLEDSVCAGMLLHKLDERDDVELVMADAAIAATLLYKGYSKNILKMIKNCEHGKYLAEIGFADDLPICAATDTVPALPQFVGNVIKLRSDAEKKEIAKIPLVS
ncbi:MAG: putative 2-phosphosulfolactate phosphatase [Bacteroidetes bacterium]|nr:putative 2-phosphosulfolactate phosphatase [Bacteroidota bacterium]